MKVGLAYQLLGVHTLILGKWRWRDAVYPGLLSKGRERRDRPSGGGFSGVGLICDHIL